MDPTKILSRAERYKRNHHRLSLDLRLKTVAEARKFLREHYVVLWNAKGELPNMLDAMLGRIANGKERMQGRPVAKCDQWRKDLLRDQEFLECRFFRKLSTAVHQDLWPYATVFSRLNTARAKEDPAVSREARMMVNLLDKEGPLPAEKIRRALKLSTPAGARLFQKTRRELQDLLILLAKEEVDVKNQDRTEVFDLWENNMPKTVRARADQLAKADAEQKLLSATLDSCVITNEKNPPGWFSWCSRKEIQESVDALVDNKKLLRITHKKNIWLIPRKVLDS